jgi:putative PIN family toxin of toxin-antitoxin system
MRLVIDTNVCVSHLLLPDSIPEQAVNLAFRHHTVILSEALLLELEAILAHPKFNPYVTRKERGNFLRKLHRLSEPITIIQRIEACRDPKDNFLLELAVNGRADAIVTGDRDLLALHPFRGIAVLTPARFIAGR